MAKEEKQNNLCDYLEWRGDIPFCYSEFNEIDALVFTQLSYNHFENLIPTTLDSFISLEDLAKKFRESPDYEKRKNNGPLINAQTSELLQLAANTNRFKNTKLCFFQNDLSISQEKQFAAFTAFLDDDTIFVAYRGTHEEIVGWKEDLNMAFETPVPAQTEAAEYLNTVAQNTKQKIRLGGHSKGGNLALYAAAFCTDKARKKIIKIFNNDGQGFEKSILETENYKKITPLIQTTIPQSSMVGILLDHRGYVKIIESSNSNLMQHDPFSWQVKGTSFVTVKARSKASLVFDKTMRNWLDAMDKERRKSVIDTLYEIISVSGAKTLTEFQECWLKSSPKTLHYLHKLDEQTKEDLKKTVLIFLKSAREGIRKKIPQETETKEK